MSGVRGADVDLGALADPSVWSTGDGAPVRSRRLRRRPRRSTDRMPLEDGSRVAVIGGGPAGSMFSYFLLRTLGLTDTRIEVDIYEPRDFSLAGPAGCNHCGGVISESLVQLLATEGIAIPSSVIQRGIEAYDLHMDIGTVQIRTPLNEKRIAAIYRSAGPRNAVNGTHVGFDQHLLGLAMDRGARVVRKLVSRIHWAGDRPEIECPDGHRAVYDLVVVATGVNSAVLRMIEDLGLGYRTPGTLKTFISEYPLGRDVLDRDFGDSMHVFLLDLPRLEFAAAIPKGEYLTVAMLGHGVDEGLVESFLNTKEVRECFPGARVPPTACHCFPRINVRGSKRPYADRLMMIGDAGVSRLYKDGIGAAYRTSKAGAMAAALHGVSAEALAAHFRPACRAISFDNAIGKFIFWVSHFIQKSRFLRRGVFRMTAYEQRTPGRKRRMSSVLWDLFTGSAPYREVFLRTLHPIFLATLVWNLVVANLPGSTLPSGEIDES
jgi:flavin-dependent dehydrogenase